MPNQVFEVTKTYEKTWRVQSESWEEALEQTKKIKTRKIEHIATSIRKIGTVKK